MKSIPITQLATALFFAAISPCLAAGGTSSGGGGALVCTNPDGSKTAKLLDLYEAESARFNLRIVNSDAPVENQIKLAFNKLNTYAPFSELLESAYSRVKEKINIVPNGKKIFLIPDFGRDYAIDIPDNCDIELAAYYESDGTLKIVSKIYNLLSNTDKAALYIHESLYFIARLAGAETSTTTRELTGYLFADGDQRKNFTLKFSKLVNAPITNVIIVPKNTSSLNLNVKFAHDTAIKDSFGNDYWPGYSSVFCSTGLGAGSFHLFYFNSRYQLPSKNLFLGSNLKLIADKNSAQLQKSEKISERNYNINIPLTDKDCRILNFRTGSMYGNTYENVYTFSTGNASLLNGLVGESAQSSKNIDNSIWGEIVGNRGFDHYFILIYE